MLKRERADFDAISTWDASYQLQASDVLWSTPAVPYVDEIARLAGKGSFRHVLDIPCGDGRNTMQLRTYAETVVGADTSRNALRLAAKRRDKCSAQNCILLRSDVFDTGFVDRSFDLVFCWDLIGHLVNARAALLELLRITSRTGYLVGSAFAEGDSTRGIDMKQITADEYLYRTQFYYRFYNRRDIEQLLASLPATVLSLELAVWSEPPHEGFREYEHEHQSWAFVLQPV